MITSAKISGSSTQFELPQLRLTLILVDLATPSGELTLEEFIEGARDHPDIMETLKTLMDLTPVLIIIIEGLQKS